MKIKISNLFLKSFTSNAKIKRNIILLGILKVLSSVIGIIMVPLILSYLEQSKYGIWLTLSSVIGWIGLLDIGFGNGLRNKLGEALTNKDDQLARKLVSTTYFSLLVLVLLANVFFYLFNSALDWTIILNIENNILNEVKPLVLIIFSLFTFRMLTGLILTILYVDHRPAVADFLVFIGTLLSLSTVYLLTLTTRNSLIYMGIGLTIFSPLVPLIASVWFFKKEYSLISPSIRFIDLTKIKGLLGQGIQFFLLQIAALILSMTDMIIISQLYGPEEVVPYNIAFRLFGYITTIFALVLAPFWAAYNEAYNKEDFLWIKQVTNKLIKTWVLLTFGVFLLILASPHIYNIWIGDKIVVPRALSMLMGLFVIIQTLNSIFATFIFSTGKLRVLTFMAIFVGLINIPLCYLFAKDFNMGVAGIILATIVCSIFNLVVGFIQYGKIISKKNEGIWAK